MWETKVNLIYNLIITKKGNKQYMNIIEKTKETVKIEIINNIHEYITNEIYEYVQIAHEHGLVDGAIDVETFIDDFTMDIKLAIANIIK